MNAHGEPSVDEVNRQQHHLSRQVYPAIIPSRLTMPTEIRSIETTSTSTIDDPPVAPLMAILSSQRCIAVSIGTCTAVARFLGWLWSMPTP